MKSKAILLIALAIVFHWSCNANSKADHYTTSSNDYNTTELFTVKTNPKTRNIQVALLLDTSNSMDGLIDQAKAQLWKIVNELSYAKCGDYAIKLQIALYEYGNSGLPSTEGYLRQVLPFSEDLDEISKELFGLTTNGGNEFCGKVIASSINELDWKNGDKHLKLIFIAGNEPFTQGPVNYKDAATDALEKDISINTIYCGDYRQGINTHWKDGADIAEGTYTAIDHNQKTIHIATPYDNVILELNNKLNNTYIHYGDAGRKKMELQAQQDSNARSYSPANAVSRTVSKSSRFYKNKSWDLVDAAEAEEFDISEVAEEELPAQLQNKTTAEKEAFINEKKQERQQIQDKIQELNKKRISYIAKNKEQEGGGLENALIKAIKAQGQEKSFSWE
ncbi:vWA domain-containing protein [Aquimarina brevivitae]|uniref:von Willebrand factor type A domain-containing protein n=1 Tax=Aquimarina brevivitae TaxID=323412 RepID=A0A4Q7PEV1_9FLAO|nr:vWA domain-containing protein [Aquimarina brevivitae]RZS98835.1 von Willebrand factor type A domain-containing protein [Aquimarina brevivitae]